MDSADESGGLGKGVIAAVAIGVLFLWALCWGLTIAILGKLTGPGQFGDMFGSVNALFSGLALGGIVLTLLLQRQELALQRKELALTRDQLTRTAKAQEASEVALSRQAAANERAARIAGLRAVVEHYGIKIAHETHTTSILDLQVERDGLITELERLIRGTEGTGS